VRDKRRERLKQRGGKKKSKTNQEKKIEKRRQRGEK
jgi:hypothetical protein